MPNPNIIRRTGGSSIVTPLGISGLSAWWKADSLSALADGTAVGNGSTTDWLDSSGHGKTMTQATSGLRPVFNTNKFGSMPGVRFSGGVFNTGKNLSTVSAISFTDYTLIFVFKYSTPADGTVMGNTTVNRQLRVGRSGANALSSYEGSTEIISNTISGLITGTTPKCVIWRRAGSTGDFFYNNTKFASSAGATSNALAFDSMGSGTLTSVPVLDGWFGEVLLYSGSKTDGQISGLYNTYLKPRWGLA